MTDAKTALRGELVSQGLAPREVRWLLDEYVGDNHEDVLALRAAASRRLSGEPLQYVLGHWPFRGLDLDVDERVLIPRPESEELVSHALSELATRDCVTPLIVDLGCGSGAIGLSLLDELAQRGVHASLVALDVSLDALDVARGNALKHHLERVCFVRSSWFEDLDDSLRGRVDLLVANPPYVGRREYDTLERVLDFEPRGALVAEDQGDVEGFADVAHIIGESPDWLAPQGTLLVEHGHAQGPAALVAATRAGFRRYRDVKDLAGKDRVLVATT